MNETCENCKYVGLIGYGPLPCKRHAPVYGSSSIPSHYPTTGSEGWCGDWEASDTSINGHTLTSTESEPEEDGCRHNWKPMQRYEAPPSVWNICAKCGKYGAYLRDGWHEHYPGANR